MYQFDTTIADCGLRVQAPAYIIKNNNIPHYVDVGSQGLIGLKGVTSIKTASVNKTHLNYFLCAYELSASSGDDFENWIQINILRGCDTFVVFTQWNRTCIQYGQETELHPRGLLLMRPFSIDCERNGVIQQTPVFIPIHVDINGFQEVLIQWTAQINKTIETYGGFLTY